MKSLLPQSSILDAVGNCSVVLCAGPGGVGKTTSSAAIALAAASAGKKVVVLTIDPARRLADALGVGLDNDPKRIDPAAVTESKLELDGELWAVMLDAHKTFDDMVERVAPTPDRAQRMFDNPVYKQLTSRLAGALEYTAVEKLYDLHDRHDFDLIVVDTPPSKNVLDFIDAPDYMAKLLKEKVLRALLVIDPRRSSKGLGKRIIRRTSRLLWDVLAKALGKDFLESIFDFLTEFEVMAPELRRRCEGIQALLRSRKTTFFVVATPEPLVAKDAAHLRAELQSRGIPFGGFVMNRMEEPTGANLDEAAEELRGLEKDRPEVSEVIDELLHACKEVDVRAQRDADVVQRLRSQTGWDGFVAQLPRQTQEIHDLTGLHSLAVYMS